jgi:hypothetical protein
VTENAQYVDRCEHVGIVLSHVDRLDFSRQTSASSEAVARDALNPERHESGRPTALVNRERSALSRHSLTLLNKSDDACAPVGAAALARSVSDNQFVARTDAEQLDALIAVLQAMKRERP